jgi:pimeloyl-ACP methyl ester carboxylesterase
VAGLALLAFGFAFAAPALATPPLTTGRSVTLAQLFSANDARALQSTLPADRPLHYRVREPAGEPRGVFIYVSPTDSGELPGDWAPVLDRARLLYIAADGFGNSRPTAERMLAALAADRLAHQFGVKDARRYIAGMSGGGRVASQLITHFPQIFSGALCIAGADYFMPPDESQRVQVTTRRLVMLTGSRDFNQREMQLMSRRYRQAGVARLLLMDLPDFAHQLPDAAQLGQALDFLVAN